MKSLLPIFGLLMLASCQQRLYFPDRVVAPGLTERYQTKIALSLKPQSNGGDSLSGKKGNNSFAADISFAATNHIGLFASYRGVNHRVIDEHNVFRGSDFGGNFTGHRWEGGLGYFNTFGDMGKFDGYLGYGEGVLKREGYYTPDKNYNTNYHRYFIQASAGAGNQIFSASGGIRLAYQRYYDFQSAGDSLRYYILDDAYPIDVTKETVGFLEPFINGEVGYRWIKFNAQFGWTIQTLGHKVAGNTPMYLHLGVVFDLCPSYFQVKKESHGTPGF